MSFRIDLRDDPATRTGNETNIYYNLTPAMLLGQIVCTEDGNTVEYVPEDSCAEDIEFSASGGFLAVRAARANKHKGEVTLNISAAGGGGSVVVEGMMPISYGKEVSGTFDTLEMTPDDVSNVTATGDLVKGDSYQLFILPDPDDNVLICYDRGFEANLGETQRAIPRKFRAVDHYVSTRGESSITLNDLLVTNTRGLRRIRGRDVTLIVKIIPQGFGLPSEVQYYTKVRLNVPMSIPEGDDSVQISGSGNFEFDLIFSA